MPSANDLRKGMAVKYNGDICIVLDMQHRTPGNLRAFVQATLRSVKSGRSSNVRFASTESIEAISMTTRQLDFSYKDHNGQRISPCLQNSFAIHTHYWATCFPKNTGAMVTFLYFSGTVTFVNENPE